MSETQHSFKEMCARFEVTPRTLRYYEYIELLSPEKDGRTRRLYFNAVPIQMIHDRWTTEYSAFWSGNLTRIKYLSEIRTPNEEKNKKKRKRARRFSNGLLLPKSHASFNTARL